MEHNRDCDTVGEVYGHSKFADSHSMSTKFDKRIAVRVTNTTESPYLTKKHTKIAEFSVVTPEQCKHIKPVDMAILNMSSQVDPDLSAYLNELLRTNKSGQQEKHILVPNT